jgi:signal transduction histidine kinase
LEETGGNSSTRRVALAWKRRHTNATAHPEPDQQLAEVSPQDVRAHRFIRIAKPGTSDATGECCIVVEDNGIGFEPKHAERIFTPFQRLHSQTKYEGTGIGLAICRKIVERHGGEITATGTSGQGAKFVVTLPRQQKEEGLPI